MATQLHFQLPSEPLTYARVYAANKSASEMSMRVPTPGQYWQDVAQCWYYYEIDGFLHSLIEKSIEIGCNGMKPWAHADAKVADIFNWWSTNVNQDVSNTLKGHDQVLEWMWRHLLLESMAVIDNDWQQVKVGRKTYWLPMRTMVHSGLNVKLASEDTRWGSERIYLALQDRNSLISQHGYYTSGTPNQYTQYASLNSFDEANVRWLKDGFALKDRYTPGRGPYPKPFITAFLKEVQGRQELVAADREKAQQLIEDIIQVIVGTDTWPARNAVKDKEGRVTQEGDVEKAAELFAVHNRSRLTAIATPHTVQLKRMGVDVAALLNTAKYAPFHNTILMNFGIVSEADASQGTADAKFNIQGFKAFLGARRKIIRRYMEQTAEEIARRNDLDLKSSPNFHWEPLNIDVTALIDLFKQLYVTGGLSLQTFHDALGLNSIEENRRISEEVKEGLMETIKRHVPVAYSQTTVKPDTEPATHDTNKQGGRPKEGGDDDE